MLALGYLVLIALIGDALARPFRVRASRPRRIATAFLVGLVATTWLTYLGGLAFASQSQPLEFGNTVALAVGGVIVAIRLGSDWRAGARLRSAWFLARPARSELIDWSVIAAIAVFVGWMMTSTLAFESGELRIGTLVWSDFGPTMAIAQSFSFGHNFPTEYPHFAGAPILYHFLFYFQVGNLTYLGFNPALANNLLSVTSMVALLVLVMELGRRLFRSATVGRLAALLFFFHGSLAFVPYLATFQSPLQALQAIGGRVGFLTSGFPYRGEEWGIWTQVVFLNQRHLASAIGLLLIVVLFVLDQVARPGTDSAVDHATAAADDFTVGMTGQPTGPSRWRRALRVAAGRAAALRERLRRPWPLIRSGLQDPTLVGYIVAGAILGMLPFWNSAVFTASAGVLAVLFVLLPNRIQMLALAATAGIAALPQIAALRPESMPRTAAFPTFHWGYVVENPTLASVGTYLGFTFGPKLLVTALVLGLGTWLQRGVFLAFTALLGAAFLVQFSVEVFANHKFINILLIILNLFVAAGLVSLWRAGSWRSLGLVARIAGRALALALVVVITAGGLIDLAPIKNNGVIGIKLTGDRLFDWVANKTRPSDVFLTDLLVVHPILLAGRRIYYGWPYYSWGAGYAVDEREQLYREMLGGVDAATVVRLLQQQEIDYVAVDDGLRNRGFVKFLNEPLLAKNLETVFADPDGRYGHVTIYRVPTEPIAPQAAGGPTLSTPTPVTMFVGGRGSGLGRFDGPRGIAVGLSGEVLVADTENHRIERFSSTGAYIGAFGGPGNQPGRFNQPNGVAVDSRGRIFVADTTNHRLQEFGASDQFVREWRGPEPGFYGPRDVTVGPGDVLYILDQGRGRVVTLAPDGTVTTFGELGGGDGQLRDPTGLAVLKDRVYVADAANGRLVIFNTDGRFVATVGIPEWQRVPAQFPDLLVAADGQKVYASSSATNQILVLGVDGQRLGELAITPPDRFEAPAAMALRPEGGLYVVEYYGQRISFIKTGP